MTEIEPRRDIPTPSLDRVLEMAGEDFLSTQTKDPTLPTHPNHGNARVGYTFHYVSYDVINQLVDSGVDPLKLGAKFLTETTLAHDEEIEDNFNGMTLSEVAKQLSIEIVKQELPKKFPNLIQENNARSKIDTQNY